MGILFAPVYIINKRPVWLTEFDELVSEEERIKHLGLIELPITVHPGLKIKVLNYHVDGTIDGLAEYMASTVPSLLVHNGVNLKIRYHFNPDLAVYLPLS